MVTGGEATVGVAVPLASTVRPGDAAEGRDPVEQLAFSRATTATSANPNPEPDLDIVLPLICGPWPLLRAATGNRR